MMHIRPQSPQLRLNYGGLLAGQISLTVSIPQETVKWAWISDSQKETHIKAHANLQALPTPSNMNLF